MGKNGLAITRPIATAIAGVPPDFPLLPLFIEGYGGTKSPKPGQKGTNNKAADLYLSGIINKFHQI